MQSLLRCLIPPFVGLVVLWAASRGLAVEPGDLIDGRAAVLVVGGPWVALALTDSWRGAASTFSGLVLESPESWTAERARVLEARVDGLAGQALGFGALAAVFAMSSGMDRIARMQGPMEASHWPLIYSGYLLGPLYAILFDVLFCAPQRARLRAERARAVELWEDA